MSDILGELRRQLSEDAVLDPVTLRQRARNYWDSTALQARALVRPTSTEELSRVMSRLLRTRTNRGGARRANRSL